MDKDDNIFLISLTEKKVLVPAITKLQENAQCAQTRNEESASETRRVMRNATQTVREGGGASYL